MGQNLKVDIDEILLRFVVTRRELEADMKRHIRSFDDVTSDELCADVCHRLGIRQAKKNRWPSH